MIKLTVYDQKRVIWINTKLICYATRFEGKTIIGFGNDNCEVFVEETLEEIGDLWNHVQ